MGDEKAHKDRGRLPHFMYKLGSLKNRAQTTLKDYRLTITASALLFLISVYSAIRLIQGEIYSEYFATSTSTIIYYSAVFIATAVMLRSRSVKDVEVFAISLSTTISAIWFYELVYHYSFPVYFNYFRYPFFDFKDLKTLFNDGGLTALILVGYRYITLRRNYYFLVSFTLFSVTYALWLLTGFYHPDGGTYLPQIIVVSDPVQLGYILNRGSKLFLSIAWIILYVKRG